MLAVAIFLLAQQSQDWTSYQAMLRRPPRTCLCFNQLLQAQQQLASGAITIRQTWHRRNWLKSLASRRMADSWATVGMEN
jgi:hypothetical protein